ncbi:MAG TPA: hypothetical protein PK393_04615 [Synergistaceae bacterium]|nr:hypothetical protein [Synergistaceae bacterium]HQF91995.1 hypothetical protein [Synergistaceae bacterium]HQH78806.1 hypothetical protein [Synergistaceae bacterium]HQK24786.1 hypothetical protein [Synergistaceae bacterium]
MVHISAKRWAGIALGALAWVGAMAWGVEAQTYIAEPVLVTQPAYAGLSFYVYRPYNMPAGWFVTRDGNYPVIQDRGGVWVYGYTVEGGALVPSGYVVGSVDPRTLASPPVPQPPLPAPAPQPRQPQRVAPPPPAPQPQPQFLPPPPPGVMVPQGCAGATVPMVSAPYVPSWALDKNFLEMSHWSRLVDRVAILHRPRTPVAWKGDNPTVLFAWTGRHWYAIRPARGETPAQALEHRLYDLLMMMRQNGMVWNDGETPALANQALLWGYLWLGSVAPAQVGGPPVDLSER